MPHRVPVPSSLCNRAGLVVGLGRGALEGGLARVAPELPEGGLARVAPEGVLHLEAQAAPERRLEKPARRPISRAREWQSRPLAASP